MVTPENRHRINILDPKYFIVEAEDDELLAKELQQTRLQHIHQTHGLIHNSQPHLLHFKSNDTSIPNPNVRNYDC